MIALREGPDSAAWNAALAVADSLLELLPKEGRPVRSANSALQNLREPIESVLASSGITGESAGETIRNLAACIDSVKAMPAQAQADKPKVVAAVAADLKIGVWLDLAGEDQKLHPAKLSWVSPISSRLMFVNRRGVRILVASVEELAAMKKLGNLVLREQEHVFDQAMHRVMGRLQNDVA